MTDILPCLIILLIPGLKDIVRHLVLKVVFVLLILWSILVQGIGVFYFDGGWHEYPVSVYSNTKRLWDWKDNPISRSVRAGPNVGIHMKWLGLSKPLGDRDFRVSYDQVRGPSQMRVKATALFEVTLSNRSENTWVTGCPGVNSINLSYHWYNKEGKAIIWDGHRSKLPFLFRPMKPTNIKLFVTAPNNPGEYILTMDLVQEHVSWFSQKGCKPKETPIEVTQ